MVHVLCYDNAMTIDTNNFKTKLLAEKALVEKELGTVARRNPQNPNDWEPAPSERDSAPPDTDERAEKIESFEENIAIVRKLEARLAEVGAALETIAHGTYGTCSVCGAEIEAARLEANPAATTCKTHMR